MKRTLAFVGDSHFDETSRWAECVAIHDWIATDISRRDEEIANLRPGPDSHQGIVGIVHVGDVYERRSTITERNAAARWIVSLTDTAPVLIIRGNHDAEGDLTILGRLASFHAEHGITVEERAGQYILGGVLVSAVSWPRKAALLAGVVQQGGASHEALAQEATRRLRDLIRGMGRAHPSHNPHVLAMHAMVRGSKTSTGQPLVGCDMEIGLEDLELAGADLTVLGHIHKPQAFGASMDHRDNVVYTGSPRRTAYGEVEQKGYVLAHFDGAHLDGWERVPTPCAPMYLVEANWRAGDWAGGMTGLPPDHTPLTRAELRFRYSVSTDDRQAAKRSAVEFREWALALGAADVKLDECVQPVTRARAPEVATARTLGNKLEALWAARGEQLDPARRARLLDWAHSLEET